LTAIATSDCVYFAHHFPCGAETTFRASVSPKFAVHVFAFAKPNQPAGKLTALSPR
jgi:hypothetical protein